MGEEREQLNIQLWNIANTLRGKMGADEFRDYILGFIFYKYLSEKISEYADSILVSDKLKFAELLDEEQYSEILSAVKEATVDEIGYYLAPNELFEVIAAKGAKKEDNFILGDLKKVLRDIEESTIGHESSDDFINLFEDLDLTSSKLGKTEKEKNEVIAKVLIHLSEIDFRLGDTDADVLGDAYEYLIGEFASSAGKKAGEFYTPPMVSRLLAKLVVLDHPKLRNAYDPTCGSGSLLLRVAKESNNPAIRIYGQELNRTTFNLARMNLILHGISFDQFDIKQDDTLKNPLHKDKKFDAVVANPPFSFKWNPTALTLDDERFAQYGKLAPASKADFAFVQHMVYSLSEEGTAAVVVPHGVLFRGAGEGVIRAHMIKSLNVIDAVIGLPANLFYGTSIPACILVLKKSRKNNNDILFIDASKYFEKVKTQNYLCAEDIERIMNAYKDRKNVDKFARVVSLQEVLDNDCNLNIPRYVNTEDEEEQVDINSVSGELKQLDMQIASCELELTKYFEELGIANPFTH